MLRTRLLLNVWLLTSVDPFACAADSDWTGFRGLEKQAYAPWAIFPQTWSKGSNIAWTASLPGRGYSSPVISQGRAYLTSAYETTKGAAIRNALQCTMVATAFTAWLCGLSLIAFRIRSQIINWADASAAFLLNSVGLSVFGLASFGPNLLNLGASPQRSWKIAVIIAGLAVTVPLLVLKTRPWVRLSGIALAFVLSIAAWLSIPRRELFLNFRSRDSITTTAIVFFPVFTSLVFIGMNRLLRTKDVTSASPVHSRPRFLRFAGQLLLPVAITAGGFVALFWQANRYPNSQVSFTPHFGWLAWLGTVTAVGVTGLAIRFFFRDSYLKACGRIAWVAGMIVAATAMITFAGIQVRRQTAFAVLSVNLESGTLDWARELCFSDNLHELKEINSRATPTIALSDDLMFVYFGSEGLYALSREGRVKWMTRDVPFESAYGLGHSPVLADGRVILVNDSDKRFGNNEIAPKAYAFDQNTGQLVWQQDRSIRKAGYSTPVVWRRAGSSVLLARDWDTITAYDVADGRVLWKYAFPQRGDHLVASMIVAENRLFLLDSSRAACLNLDALSSGRDPLIWNTIINWEKSSSPVLVNELLFGVTENGMAFCIDAKSGELVWREKLEGRFFASLLGFADSVLFTSESGDSWLVRASREFELLSKNSLEEKTYATPAPLRDSLLIRGVTHLYCVAETALKP